MKESHIRTKLAHAGDLELAKKIQSGVSGPKVLPIYMSSVFTFDDVPSLDAVYAGEADGYVYSRMTNPSTDAAEEMLAAAEGADGALVFSSGMAAIINAIIANVQAGDHIVSSPVLYGGVYDYFKHELHRFGVEVTFVEFDDPAKVEAAIRPNTKVVYAETFGNPNSDVTNLEAVAAVAHRHNIPFIVDNTFGTPYIIRPIEHGADVVVHSATKFIGGHGSSLGGVIVDGGTFDWKANADKYPTLAKPDPSYHGAIFADVAGKAAFVTRIRAVILRDTGATISPFNAWILLQGLETLSLRVERHVENALKVVKYLASNPKVEKVNHPSLPTHPDHELYEKYFPNGGGSIFTFEIKGGQEAAWRFIDHLKIFSLLANVADVKSLAIHPATTTHSQMSPEELAQQHITPSTIRLSIGTEHIDDIIDDLQQAFDAI